jgi:murein L,D-transpeptidase YafK
MNKIFLGVVISLVAAGLALASNQLLVVPWSVLDLPNMNNPNLRISKSNRTLEVFDGDSLIRTYKIALGSEPVGDKEVEGDGKTPEGEFFIFTKNPKSSFYLSLGLSYPNIEDAQRGLENELISQEEHDLIVEAINAKKMPPQKTALGGEIYIHGSGNIADWTAGCVAMTNSEMKELFDALPAGTKVVIEP